MYDKLGNEKNILEESDIQSGSSYIKFPDGTMIQYGTATMSNIGDEMKHINFPNNFINSSYAVSIQNFYVYNKEIVYSISSLDINGFDVHTNKAIDTVLKIIYFSWMAIGRWK